MVVTTSKLIGFGRPPCMEQVGMAAAGNSYTELVGHISSNLFTIAASGNSGEFAKRITQDGLTGHQLHTAGFKSKDLVSGGYDCLQLLQVSANM
eukprot:687454-Pyramimonas_sp.AAC.2